MSNDVTIIEKEARHALAISDIVGTMKLGKVMRPAYEEIMAAINEQGIDLAPEDVPFTLYRNIDWDSFDKKGVLATIKVMFFHKWDIQMGIPCPESAKASGRIASLTLDAGKFIRTIHKGPYMKVGDAYNKIKAFAKQENLNLKDYSVEFYLNNPREVAETDIETEVLVPVG